MAAMTMSIQDRRFDVAFMGEQWLGVSSAVGIIMRNASPLSPHEFLYAVQEFRRGFSPCLSATCCDGHYR
jgi:hypothetical protein